MHSSLAFASAFVPKTILPKGPVIAPAMCPRTAPVRAAWTRVATKEDLAAAGGKKVVEAGGQKILLADFQGTVYAVSNKCTHLGLPLEGKVLKANITKEGCVACGAHNTAFDLKTGEVKGEWSPKFPSLPLIGKGTKEKPLPTFPARVVGNDIEIDV